MMKGSRYNIGKLKWSLVSWRALEPMVQVLMFGAEKYAPNNWKGGLKYTEICESLQRHMNSFLEGEDDDKESKLQHIGHILCNAMFLSYMVIFRKDLDDRFIDSNIIDKYPFKEGDDYWTIEDGEVVWSCWDDISEEIYDRDKTYYKNSVEATKNLNNA